MDETLSSLSSSPSLSNVYFSGAEATGKTELCKLVEASYGLPRLHEAARAVLGEQESSFGQLRARVRDANAYQRAVFARQIEMETAAESNGRRPFVSDRTVLDNLAYASDNASAECFADLHERGDLAELVRGRLVRGVVFLVRPHRALRAKDGVRAGASYADKLRIDTKIELLLQIWRVRFISVEMLGANRREELIDYVLEGQGFKKVTATR